MSSDLPRFTFRTSREILDKLKYIADDNFRTLNKELEMMAVKRITEYEAEHGEIVVPDEAE